MIPQNTQVESKPVLDEGKLPVEKTEDNESLNAEIPPKTDETSEVEPEKVIENTEPDSTENIDVEKLVEKDEVEEPIEKVEKPIEKVEEPIEKVVKEPIKKAESKPVKKTEVSKPAVKYKPTKVSKAGSKAKKVKQSEVSDPSDKPVVPPLKIPKKVVVSESHVERRPQIEKARLKQRYVTPIRPLNHVKKWERPSSSFVSRTKRNGYTRSSLTNAHSCLPAHKLTTFRIKRKKLFSAAFRSNTERKGALETPSGKYPNVPISYLGKRHSMFRPTKSQRLRLSSATKRLFQIDDSLRFTTPGPGMFYFVLMLGHYVSFSQTDIWSKPNRKRWNNVIRGSHTFLSKCERLAYVKKSLSSTIDFYSPKNHWLKEKKKKNVRRPPFGTSVGCVRRDSYVPKTLSSTMCVERKLNTFKKQKEGLYSTFGVEERMKNLKNLTGSVPSYQKPYGYPFESEYKILK